MCVSLAYNRNKEHILFLVIMLLQFCKLETKKPLINHTISLYLSIGYIWSAYVNAPQQTIWEFSFPPRLLLKCRTPVLRRPVTFIQVSDYWMCQILKVKMLIFIFLSDFLISFFPPTNGGFNVRHTIFAEAFTKINTFHENSTNCKISLFNQWINPIHEKNTDQKSYSSSNFNISWLWFVFHKYIKIISI